MYFSEKIIDGVMHCKYTPTGQWHKMDDKRLTAYIVKLKEDVKRLEEKA